MAIEWLWRTRIGYIVAVSLIILIWLLIVETIIHIRARK